MGRCQKVPKVPKFDFQSQFSTSKIIRIFLNFFELYQFRSTFFVIYDRGYRITRGKHQGRQILCFCNLEAHHPQIFRKCYFLYSFHITEEVFSWKSTLRLSYRYATFARLRVPTSESVLMLIWCFWIGHKSGFLQEFRKPSFCNGNIFYEPEAVFSNLSIFLRPQIWVASIFQEIMFINRLKKGRK